MVIDRLMRPVGPTCVMLSKSACFVRVHSDEDLGWWFVFAVLAGNADWWFDVIVWMAPVRDGCWFGPFGSAESISSVIRAFGGCLGTRRR